MQVQIILFMAFNVVMFIYFLIFFGLDTLSSVLTKKGGFLEYKLTKKICPQP